MNPFYKNYLEFKKKKKKKTANRIKIAELLLTIYKEG